MGGGVFGKGGGADDDWAAEVEPLVVVEGGAPDDALGDAPRELEAIAFVGGVEIATRSGLLLSCPLCTRCALAVKTASRRLCWC